jgi:hypothetical protein
MHGCMAPASGRLVLGLCSFSMLDEWIAVKLWSPLTRAAAWDFLIHKVHMQLDKVSAPSHTDLLHDGREPSSMGKARDWRYLQEVPLGGQRCFDAREMYCGMGGRLQTYRAGRPRHYWPQARGLCPANKVALASEDRPEPRLESASNQDCARSLGVFLSFHIHHRWWLQDCSLLGGSVGSGNITCGLGSKPGSTGVIENQGKTYSFPGSCEQTLDQRRCWWGCQRMQSLSTWSSRKPWRPSL